MRVWERLIGRVIAATIMGAALGYGVGLSINRDAERGKALTREAYIAQFDEQKAQLEKTGGPLAVYVIAVVIMSLALFGAYEGLSWGAERAVAALGRSRNPTGVPPFQGTSVGRDG
jgi:hypothetical protein